MICYRHRAAEAVGVCRTCGRGLCGACARENSRGLVCAGDCLSKPTLPSRTVASLRRRIRSPAGAYSPYAQASLWEALRPYKRYLYLLGAMAIAALAGKALN